jgi:hypothetical protein
MKVLVQKLISTIIKFTSPLEFAGLKDISSGWPRDNP